MLPKIFHNDHGTLYAYQPTPVGYGIGTQNLAFETPGSFYPRQSVAGRGIKAGHAPSPLQHAQVYIPRQAVPLVGLGGLQAGTVYQSPLQVPPDTTATFD